jgi:hypothetical protein
VGGGFQFLKMPRGACFWNCGLLCFLLTHAISFAQKSAPIGTAAWGTDTAVEDAFQRNPYALPSGPQPDPNEELKDAPVPGQKTSDSGTATADGEASVLAPFYVRTGIGLSFITNVDYPDFGINSTVNMAPGFATGVMLGAQFHDNVAFEIEGGLLYNSVYSNQTGGITATDLTQVTNVQLFQVPMMGNFIFRTDPLGATRIRLVAGGGAGGIFRQVFITGSPNDVTRSQTVTAFQGFGGIQINPGEPDLMVDVQFRYLNSLAGQSVPSMSIMGTVTIRF